MFSLQHLSLMVCPKSDRHQDCFISSCSLQIQIGHTALHLTNIRTCEFLSDIFYFVDLADQAVSSGTGLDTYRYLSDIGDDFNFIEIAMTKDAELWLSNDQVQATGPVSYAAFRKDAMEFIAGLLTSLTHFGQSEAKAAFPQDYTPPAHLLDELRAIHPSAADLLKIACILELRQIDLSGLAGWVLYDPEMIQPPEIDG